MEKPELVHDLDLDDVIKACEELIEFYDTDAHEDKQDDYRHYVYEETLKALYGSDIFDWINSKTE